MSQYGNYKSRLEPISEVDLMLLMLNPYVINKIKSYGYEPYHACENFIKFRERIKHRNKKPSECISICNNNTSSFISMIDNPIFFFVKSSKSNYFIDVIKTTTL